MLQWIKVSILNAFSGQSLFVFVEFQHSKISDIFIFLRITAQFARWQGKCYPGQDVEARA